LSKDDPQADSFRSETPQREVTIGYQLAAGEFDVTFDEWDFCARWSSVDPPGGMRRSATPMPEGASVAMAFSMALCGMRIVCTLPG
jgi:hypothetical protein